MNAADLFGYAPPVAPFKDIRPQRNSVAEEKARLCLELGRLCQQVPEWVRGADVRRTRDWLAAVDRAKKVLGNKRSSTHVLGHAVRDMQERAKPPQ